MYGYDVNVCAPDNIFKQCLGEAPSTYQLLQVMQNLADMTDNLRTFKFDTCPDGCLPFYRDDKLLNCCSQCDKPRWKHCTDECFDEEGVKLCDHAKISSRVVYYMSIEDRMRKLLNSDVQMMLKYPTYRKKSSVDGIVQDVFDTETYKAFEDIVPEGGVLIYVQVCWDGADMFNFSGKSMWPLCYCIMNFPPASRDKVHVGMHVASFDDGSDAALVLFAEEMLYLWEHGIEVDGTTYYVCCPQIIMDGRGREKFCKCQVSLTYNYV
jgi:hypothetical protein